MKKLRRNITAGVLFALLIGIAYSNPAGGEGGPSGYTFTTPAQYREMVLTTPDASNAVEITGHSAYHSSDWHIWEVSTFMAGRTVRLSPFKIARYETTYELWYEVKQWAASNGYTFANPGREGHDGTGGAAPTSGAKTEPVTGITWRDAIVWCNAYSEMNGKDPVYYTGSGYGTVLRVSTNTRGTGTAADSAVMKPGALGYRLPTEAQWEYAARGGRTPALTTPFTYAYAGSNTLNDVAWHHGNSPNGTHPVGEKAANTLGLYDMSGNAEEWCWDWFSRSISTGSESDPVGAASGTTRVLRGGSWDHAAASLCEVSSRFNLNPYLHGEGLSFRVVCP
ncbi:MAG: formylglycine-generating enzyme family protein [Spirochaetaceae bacterium]|jgi:formylglycine-generating enzyme required for sulfatase activity|nr:formylglycine-generating enzyme family protein [Spirochaetaceae bacterium]